MEYKHNSLDTSILVRLFTNDRPDLFRQIQNFIERGDRLFYVDDQVISELVYVLSDKAGIYQFPRPQVADFVEAIIFYPVFITNVGRIAKVLRLYRAHPKLSFNDCYLAVTAEEHKATPLWTLDHKLALQTSAASEFPTDLVE